MDFSQARLEGVSPYSLIAGSRIIHEMSQFPNPNLAGEKALSPGNSNHTFEWPLRPMWRASLFLIPLIAASLWLSHVAIVVARVTYQTETVSIPDIQKAISQDPHNADLIHRLGYVYATSPTDIDISESVKNLRRAIALNPRRWDYWEDLGKSCDFAGDMACSDEAFDRTLALNPMTPAMQWTVGNHYLLTNRERKAYPYFRRLLGMDPTYLEPTLRVCLRATRDPQTIYTEVVPQGKDPSGRFAFLMFLSNTADYENAMRIWGQMIAGPDPAPDLSIVAPFLDFLIDHNQIQDAGMVWNDLKRTGVIPPQQGAETGTLLYDGGFEDPPLNTGFDWRASDSSDLDFDFSDPSAYKGTKCLRVKFVVGRNANYELVNQVVLIKPNTRYQLTAYVRSDNLTSESGPRLRVLEMGCEGCTPRASDPTVGSTEWHPIQVAFMTQPQTQAVRISFWRPQDQVSHGDITGTVWLDDVTLRILESPISAVSQVRTR